MFFIFCFYIISGCSFFSNYTIDDVKNARGSGQKNIYSSSYKKTMQAIPLALRESGFEILSINRDVGIISQESYVLAKYYQPGEPKAMGDIFAVFARKESGMTEVEITTDTMRTGDLATELIFYQIEKKLNEIEPNKKATIRKPSNKNLSKNYFIESDILSIEFNKKLIKSFAVGILYSFSLDYEEKYTDIPTHVSKNSFGVQLKYILNGKDIAQDSGWCINPFFFYNINYLETDEGYKNSKKSTIYNKEFGLLVGYQMFRKRSPWGLNISAGISRPFDNYLYTTLFTPDYLAKKCRINIIFKFSLIYSF